MPANIKTGKITKLTSKPRGFVLTVPGVPPDPGTEITFNADVDEDDYNTASAAYAKGSDADVDDAHPSVGSAGVTAK